MPKSLFGRRIGRRSGDSDPVVDIERLLVNYAWTEIAETSCMDRLLRHQRYDLTVNWAYFDISHRVTSFQPRSRNLLGGTDDNPVSRRDLCLFRTEFINSSFEIQNFTFKTERTTTSRCDISLQRGYRIGANVDVRVALPMSESNRITGGLSSELHVTKATGQTFEEVLTWSVDSQVVVPRRTKATASLLIREEDFCADLTIDSVIRPLYDSIPVYVRSRKTGRTLELIGIQSTELPEILTDADGFLPVTEGGCAVRRETKGVARLVYGAEQVVDVSMTSLDGQLPAIPSTLKTDTTRDQVNAAMNASS